ncbi:aldehyde dehydrogenase family protein [Williamsia soli]|uniref:aldehyde dehydrogenase family protein n=1 Tax=Williamsia soli TaxID=364929 RepID=UPI001A9EDE64|nr:aldehyde dehydrogenase family protein [Williamsia soli]
MTTTSELLTVGHLIDGALTSVDQYTDVQDPGRLSELAARVAVGTVDDVNRAVTAAHTAYQTWKNVPHEERARLLLEAADALSASAEDLAPQLVREHGGMLWEAQTDFGLGTGVLQHTASLIEGFFEPVQYDDEQSFISIERVPRGVVAAVVPWNMPVVLTMMKLAPALATGNTIVIKPSPFAPAALTIALERMSRHLPAGVVNVVHGHTDVGAALTSHPLVRKVGFTGGVATARKVMESAAGTIKNITLELGGNDPAVVLDDVDIDAALDRMLKGVYTRTGQICFAVKRIYVPRSRYAAFADAFCERVDSYAVGHGLDEAASFGPLNNKTQYDSVTALIEATKNTSAKTVQLGKKLDSASDGYYVMPHVIRDADNDSAISTCEQFGPIVPLIAYDNLDQAIDWANDSEYGLGSSVWTTDTDRGLEVARRIEAGSTFVNTHSFDSLDLRMPFGGIKQSGIGREFGTAGMSEYVEEHSLRILK